MHQHQQHLPNMNTTRDSESFELLPMQKLQDPVELEAVPSAFIKAYYMSPCHS